MNNVNGRPTYYADVITQAAEASAPPSATPQQAAALTQAQNNFRSAAYTTALDANHGASQSTLTTDENNESQSAAALVEAASAAGVTFYGATGQPLDTNEIAAEFPSALQTTLSETLTQTPNTGPLTIGNPPNDVI